MLGDAYADAVTVRVDHGLEVSGRVDPIVDGTLSSIGCAGEHSQVITEAVGVTASTAALLSSGE